MAHDWKIGSGEIESASKAVVGHRTTATSRNWGFMKSGSRISPVSPRL